MAANVTATRSSSLFTDHDGDGQFDPGDIITTRIRITVGPGDDALGVTVNATTNGLTVNANDPNAVQVTPIAFDDFLPSITGNTPMTFTAAQLLGNDIDPDGPEVALTITGVSGASNGSIVNNGNGTFTFTPTTGYVGTASFQYTITDEDGLASVSTGIVSFSVTDPVWYVNAATGSDITGDGSWAKPFATLAPLSTGGSADSLDNADDTIFVYNEGTYANASIVLETGQKLYGDGHAFTVNNLAIGANASNTTLGHTGVAVTLASNNTIMGVSLNGAAGGAVGIQDNGNVGTLTIDNSSIIGQGKAVDIDSGGTLNVDFDTLSSASSTSEGIHLQGVTGTFNATAGTIQSSGGVAVLIGAADGLTASSGGDVNFTYGGDITNPTGSIVNIQDRTGGTVTFSGTITDSAIGSGTAGIFIDGSAGTINFNGQTTIGTGANAGNGVTLTSNSGTINFNAAGTGLDITTASGTGLTFVGGGTLNITGSGNSVVTGTGSILNLQNGAMGTSGIAFQTLTGGSLVSASGHAINIVNLDAAGAGTFSGGAVTIAGVANGDGIVIASSNSTFNFASATIDNTSGDGIEVNGQTQTQGAVTFGTVDLDGMGAVGLNIAGATNAVNVNGGTIGASNDPAGDGVRIIGGSGAVTVAASVTQSTGGNNVIDVSGHSGGTITFSGAITAGVGGGGIRVLDNPNGNIDFTGNVTLNTGTLNALTFTNYHATGANLTFSEGTLDIDTTSGTGIHAANSNIGAGSLTVSGGDNFVNSTTGRAIHIENVTANVTLEQVGVSGGGTTTGVFLKNTGSGGQFVVTGTGSTAGSGGTFNAIGGVDVGSIGGAATTGTGIYMENVSNVSLSNLSFTGAFTNFGIRGENVNNFTLRDSAFTGTFGDNVNFDEAAIRFGTQLGAAGTANGSTGLTGTALFEGNTIGGGVEDNLAVYTYGANTLNLTIRDNATSGDQAVFNNNHNVTGNDGFFLESGGTSNVTVNVTGVAFNGARGDLLHVLSVGSTTQTIVVQNNQFLNAHTNQITGGGGIAITGGGTNINVDYVVDTNTFKGMRGSGIFSSFGGTSGNISGLVTNNQMGTNNGVYENSLANRGSLEGMFFFGGIDAKVAASTGNINYALRIEGNTIRDTGGSAAILLRSNQQSSTGQARLEATIANNTMAEFGGPLFNGGGIYLQPGGADLNNDKGTMGLNISNNNINTLGTGNDAIVFDQAAVPASFYMPGYTSAPSANPANLRNFLVNTKGNVLQADSADDITANTSAVQNQAFQLTVPSAMAPGFAIGWEDLAVSPVTAPPRDPEPATGSGDSGNGSGGGTGTGTGAGTGAETGNGSGTGSGGGTVPAPAADDGIISADELGLLVEAAIQRWIDAGATASQVEAMRAVQFGIVDMAGIYVGSSSNGIIQIDNDAAGYGWFVDSTPGEDSEFEGSGNRLTADAGGAAAGKLDLLTVLMHELGHQIGLDDEYVSAHAGDLMYGYVNAGERRLPAQGEAAGAVPGSVGSTAYAIAPVNIGTIPDGKTVDVLIKATINAQTDGFIVNPVNTATVSGSNFSDQVAQETLSLDSLTLGNLVFLDANKDGDYDSGTDSGIVGVVVDLYADTNDSGGWDVGDAFLGTTTTVAGGLYSFAGLAPGDYVVVVKSTNFDSGGALHNKLVAPGAVADPDATNQDGDNNGIAAAGGAVAAQTITLAFNTEPTNGTGNDTNNTVDFGFVENGPPVANDDTGLTATEDQASQYSTELTGNDTDPDGDPRTIVSAGNATNGSVSVAAGVVTFTPTANFNGTATFEYTIDDGYGHQDTAVATVTVGAVNDPVSTTAPATLAVNEDSVNSAVTGLSIGDVDSALAPAGIYKVTLSTTEGTLSLTANGGITFSAGDGFADKTMTFRGTLADVNTALATVKYTAAPHYAGADQIVFQATDEHGAVVATGTGSATSDTDTIAVTVNSVNDAPEGTDDSAAVLEGIPYEFSPNDFSDGFSDPVDGNSFAGVKITELPLAGTLKLNGTAISAGDTITLAQLTAGDFTYTSPAGSAGSSPTFKFAVQDNGGDANGGVEYDQSPNVFTLNIVPADIAPTIDLDGDNSSGAAGSGFSSAYTEGGAAASIADVDIVIGDVDSGDMVEGATITIANAAAGDVLTVVGALPGSITVDADHSSSTILVLKGTGTQDEYEAAIRQITFSNTGDDPTAGGTKTTRTINVTVSDGDLLSNTAVATISVADDNADAPAGTSSTITAVEDGFRLLKLADLGFSDSDGTFASVTISAVTGGGIYFDSDGSAGPGQPVLETLPKTYGAQDLVDGKVSFRAGPDANGNALGTISFAVTDDDGNTDDSPATLTVHVTAVNDSPVLTTGGPIAATEQTAVAILPAGSVADVDLDALNNGNGDYAGSTFSVNRNPATNPTEDVFTLVAGPNFTVDGSSLKTAGGQIFGTISVNGSAGLIVVNFTSQQAIATSALVDEVIQAVRYTNTSDNPPASVDLAVGFDDGSPGGGQGSGAGDLDVNLVTVNLTGTNDAPVLDLNGAASGTGTTLAFSEGDGATPIATGATVSDIDSANFENGTLVVDLTKVGTGDYLSIVAGNGITIDNGGQKVLYNGVEIASYAISNLAATYTYTFNAAADAAAVQALVRQVSFANQNDNQLSGDRTVSYTLSDGDGGTASVVTATISVTAADDAPVAQPDAVGTPENVVGTGSLFADNGSGADSDPDGGSMTVSHVNGNPVVDGQEIVLASGAKLIVNADGTYSYDPNGKFNRLTDNSSGAVNTSAVGDTFTYTLTGGNTVTVTVTVNGVAGPGDWLMGNGAGNTITGTPQADTFVVSQGGNDTVNGLAGDDIFYFGGALTADDNVNGGSGSDTIVLQGDYSGGLTLDGSVTGVESISMLAGTNVNFGNPGSNLYDYVLTTHDSNFAAGTQVRINGSALLADEDLTFDGSAETDARFVVYGGRGTDDLTGGAGNDIFFFAEGRYAPGDVVDGGGGYDGLFLRGNYTIDFKAAGFAGALSGLENLTVSGAADERYGRGGGAEFDYSIVWDGDLLAAGQTMTINGATLGSEESLAFNGSDETNGSFKIFGGAGIDVLVGGDGADLIFGGLRGDTLTGGDGNDIFRYDSVAESNSTERDGIQDFNSGDLIDLSRIDANSLIEGNQAFNFIGNAEFSGTAGELRFQNYSSGGPVWLVQADTDGNGVSDFEVILVINPPDPITAGDFIL